MDGSLLIRAVGLSKTYPSRADALRYMAGLLSGGFDRGPGKALSDVGFSLSRGEALGVVGRNGAGKSTLLQIVCGTQTPDAGTVERHGRIAAMLELGAGFHPEFTGRENAALNASVYGLSDRQVALRMPLIEAFADIGDFIDRPVREYSSGMRARLAFAVCAHVDADILVVDEVLAVGDWAFQVKCRKFIEEFLLRGAVLLVSHDEHAVLSMCGRAIWLEQGRMIADGPADTVLRRYREAMVAGDAVAGDTPEPEPEVSAVVPSECGEVRAGDNPIEIARRRADAPSHGHGGAIIDDVYLSDASGTHIHRCLGGQRVDLNIRGRALREINGPILGFIFRDALGQNLFGDNTWSAYRDRPRTIAAGDRFHAIFRFRMPLLPKGIYTIAPSIIEGTQQNHVHLHWIEDAIVLAVHESPVSIGLIGVPVAATARLRPGRRPAEEQPALPADSAVDF